jgi:hypothetical protein
MPALLQRTGLEGVVALLHCSPGKPSEVSSGAYRAHSFGKRDLAIRTAIAAQSTVTSCRVLKLVPLTSFSLIIAQEYANKLCKEDMVAVLLKLMYLPSR